MAGASTKCYLIVFGLMDSDHLLGRTILSAVHPVVEDTICIDLLIVDHYTMWPGFVECLLQDNNLSGRIKDREFHQSFFWKVKPDKGCPIPWVWLILIQCKLKW